MQGSGASAGDLIAVKADGRGGRIKVLQSINLASLDNNNENLPSFKRYMRRTRSSSSQSHRFFNADKSWSIKYRASIYFIANEVDFMLVSEGQDVF